MKSITKQTKWKHIMQVYVLFHKDYGSALVSMWEDNRLLMDYLTVAKWWGLSYSISKDANL